MNKLQENKFMLMVNESIINNSPKAPKPTSPLKTIQLDKETLNDLIQIVDARINFINDNVYLNRPFLEPQRDRLKALFRILDVLSIEK